MSERMTAVKLPGLNGFANYGKLSRIEIISQYRALARHRLEESQRILSASDSEFIVEQFTGIHAQRNKITLLHDNRKMMP